VKLGSICKLYSSANFSTCRITAQVLHFHFDTQILASNKLLQSISSILWFLASKNRSTEDKKGGFERDKKQNHGFRAHHHLFAPPQQNLRACFVSFLRRSVCLLVVNFGSSFAHAETPLSICQLLCIFSETPEISLKLHVKKMEVISLRSML